MKFKFKNISALCVCFLVGLLNQNCGQQSSFSVEDLAANHSPSMLDVDLPESQARLGDRVFIASVLSDVFLPKGNELTQAEATALAGDESMQIAEYISDNFVKAQDAPLVEEIDKFVLSQITEFHGLCSIVDDDKVCSSRNETVRRNAAEVQTIAPVSVTRDGYRISVCSKLLGIDRAVGNMIFNITNVRTSIMLESNIMDVYDAFYPEQGIDPEAYEALVDVYRSVSSEAEIDKWRAVALPVCQSSGWQIQ